MIFACRWFDAQSRSQYFRRRILLGDSGYFGGGNGVAQN
jgi:hypothetical protein